MNNDETHNEQLKALSYVKRSKNRVKVVNIIGTSIKIPSEIAETMGLRINQISAILKDLKENNIVICLNEADRTGRLYQLTPKGLEVYKFLTDMENQN